MKIAIIGAAGFIGQRIARLLIEHPADTDTHSTVTLIDRSPLPTIGEAIKFVGSFSDSSLRDAALHDAGVVIMLAAALGGAAEADPQRAREINLDATLDLISYLQQLPQNPRLVFASTVAVYGEDLDSPVTDATSLSPVMLYGAHKLMIEVLLSTLARRGQLDAVSLRPSGVMARAGSDSGLTSAFMSRLFYAIRQSRDIVLPVEPDSRTWLASVDNVAKNFIHAALLPDLGQNRAFTLPALSLSFAELVDALHSNFPDSRSKVAYEPDEQIIALFGRYPDLQTETATRLGFTRDHDAVALVRSAF